LELTDKTTRDGALLWRLAEDYHVQVGCGAFTIPKGFHTDFASVPRFLQPLLSEHAIRSVPSVAHDWLYFNGEPKRIADAVFFELLGDLKDVPEWQRLVMFTAVEWFGGAAYKAHRDKGHPILNVNRFD
jgi:hypothetical protein